MGLQPDDLIVFVNGELVHSIRTLAVTLGRLEAEDDLRLIIRRGKALIPVEMRVPRPRRTPVMRSRRMPARRTDMNRYCATLAVAALLLNCTTTRTFAQVDALEQEAFQQATALAGPSIVRIETIGGRDVVGELITGTGPTTGVVVSSDGYVITSSFNFIAQPAQILVTLPDDRRFTAEVVARDTSKMLTLLKVDVDGLEPLAATPKDDLRVGQWSLALGRTYSNTFPNLSVGIISALGRIDGKAIQTDAKVSPANYGGPLVDIEGRGMGILVPLSPQKSDETAGVEWYDSGIGFAVPLEDIYAVLPRLKAGEDLAPGRMGVTFEDTGPLAGEAKIEQGSPALPR